MKPVICKVPPEVAAPFTIDYCKKYGIPHNGDPSFGNEVLWFGAAYRGAIRAVIGFIGIDEGVYVFGFYKDKSTFGARALLALNKWVYDLDLPLWGHIREDNPKMWNRVLKEGWQITGSTKTLELLMHRPSPHKANMVKCQELINI